MNLKGLQAYSIAVGQDVALPDRSGYDHKTQVTELQPLKKEVNEDIIDL